jgi:hypothetical protein
MQNSIHTSPNAIFGLFQPWKGSFKARNFEVINGLQHVFEKWVEHYKKFIACQGRRDSYCTSTKFQLRVIRWVNELSKLPLYNLWGSYQTILFLSVVNASSWRFVVYDNVTCLLYNRFTFLTKSQGCTFPICSSALLQCTVWWAAANVNIKTPLFSRRGFACSLTFLYVHISF